MRLSEFEGGKLQRMFDAELKKAILNIKNPMTDYRPVRKITITVCLATDSERDLVEVMASVDHKFPPETRVAKEQMYIGMDDDGFKLEELKYSDHLEGQMTLEDFDNMDLETGEIK